MGASALALGCGAAPSLPRGYELALRRAEGLERDGRHSAAADAYAQSRLRCGGRADLCARAAVREAAERERAGEPDRARRSYLEAARRWPHDREAPRALRRAARIDLVQGRADDGRSLLRAAISRYPDHGDAAAALRDLLQSVEDREGEAAALAEATSLDRVARVRSSALGDNVLYAIAALRIRLADPAAAERALVDLVDRYPYPRGGLWDEALWLLADLAEVRRDFRAVVRWLERMVAVQESSSIVGSYNLPRFDDAELRIARTWLGPLGDARRAVRAAERLRDRYPDSVLRDDAIVLQARAEEALGHHERACALRSVLAREDPHSRYLRPGRWPVRCGPRQ
ncbi:MAG: STAS/SEC14 domain-containing protein [Deltaproteobacteria bacterium]|nr:STAS/SEC14 domain-containing protein [Deltaproteobacteria bacterium]